MKALHKTLQVYLIPVSRNSWPAPPTQLVQSQQSRHVLQTTSSCRWEATGASPLGTEDNSGPAVFQLLLEPGRAVTHREMRPQLVTSTHSCTLPALVLLLAQRCLSHPQPIYMGRSSLQRSLPSSAAQQLLLTLSWEKTGCCSCTQGDGTHCLSEIGQRYNYR